MVQLHALVRGHDVLVLVVPEELHYISDELLAAERIMLVLLIMCMDGHPFEELYERIVIFDVRAPL